MPGSRPPLRVDALDPWFTVVDGQELTVLECLELWERMVREMRGLAPYGPASAARSAVAARSGDAGYDATLTGVVRFLGAQVAWMSTEPDFPVEDFADEVTACVRVLRRFDLNAEHQGTQLRCPTVMDDGSACDRPLRYRELTEQITCRRCGQTRDAATLALLAMEDGREVWLDPEAAARHFAVDEMALARWARSGRIKVSHGRYLLSSIDDAIAAARSDGYSRLARYMAR